MHVSIYEKVVGIRNVLTVIIFRRKYLSCLLNYVRETCWCQIERDPDRIRDTELLKFPKAGIRDLQINRGFGIGIPLGSTVH
jgi:hypothetical protein